MSLKKAGAGMLGIDHQHGGKTAHEPGANPGLPAGQ